MLTQQGKLPSAPCPADNNNPTSMKLKKIKWVSLCKPTCSSMASCSTRAAGPSSAVLQSSILPVPTVRHAKKWDKVSPYMHKKFLEHGIQLQEWLTSGPGSAAVLASKASAAGVDVVLAVGGDGTVHEAISGLVQQQQQQQSQKGREPQPARPETALAVLPLGTGSDYARTFCWRINDAAEACERITRGKVQLTDVSVLYSQSVQLPHWTAAAALGQNMQKAAASAGGQCTPQCTSQCTPQCRYVVNVASCAVGALATARAARLKQLGPLCYPVGGALTLLGWRGCSVQVCLDDCAEWQVLDNLTTLVLGHGQFWGGGLQILPDADPTDGFMDAVALQGLGLWDFISKGHLLRSGQHMHVKGVNMLGKCRRLQVRPEEEGALLAWECDGEPQGLFTAVDIRLLPGALRLLSGKPARAVNN